MPSSLGRECAEENETTPLVEEEGRIVSAFRKKHDTDRLAKQQVTKDEGLLVHAASSMQGHASSLHLIANLITCGLGTGVFTLPWSTAGASIVPALLIIALVLALNAWTISILVEAAERHQVFDLGSLLARLPGHLGKVAQVFCNCVLGISMFLVLVGYIVVIADCSLSSMPILGGAPSVRQRSTVVALSSALILPLCFLDQRRLSMTSILAVCANGVIFAQLLAQFGFEEVDGSRPPICFLGISWGSIAMVSAMMQTVVIQMCVLPMYKELTDRSPEKFNRITAISFTALFFICAGYSVAGYITYGRGVSSNVLLNLPRTHWGQLSRLGAAAAVAAVFPIILGPMVAPLANTESNEARGFVHGQKIQSIAICGIVGAVMVAALFVHDLGFLNVVNGAMSMGVFVALVPSLVGLHLLGPRSTMPAWRSLMFSLAILGFLFSIVGMVMTDNFAKYDCAFPHFTT